MKKLIIPCLAAVALMSLSACSTVNERKGEATHSTTTTTEQTTVPAPVTTTTTDTKTQSQ